MYLVSLCTDQSAKMISDMPVTMAIRKSGINIPRTGHSPWLLK
jgi:hypothetical protein